MVIIYYFLSDEAQNELAYLHIHIHCIMMQMHMYACQHCDSITCSGRQCVVTIVEN